MARKITGTTVNEAGGDIVVANEIVSLKCTSDRRVWVKWEGKNARFCDTGVKMSKGFSRNEKTHHLVDEHEKIVARFFEERYTDEDIDRLSQASMVAEDELNKPREEGGVSSEDHKTKNNSTEVKKSG